MKNLAWTTHLPAIVAEDADGLKLGSRFRYVQDLNEAQTIQSRYEIFAKRAGISPANLVMHLLTGNGIVWSPYQCEDSYVGSFIGEVFVVSHFAPISLRAATASLMDLLYTETPVAFAVPDNLGDQLERLGYDVKVRGVPMTFRGMTMDKVVLVNKSVTSEHLKPLLMYWMNEAVRSGQLEKDERTAQFFSAVRGLTSGAETPILLD